MKTLLIFSIISIITLVSCVQGRYVSEEPMASAPASSCNTMAPMDLKSRHRVNWTRYAYTNSYASPYIENAKWKKKSDTIFLKQAIYNGDDVVKTKVYEPTFVVKGDTLQSIHSSCATYVKAKGKEKKNAKRSH